jgi:hypothetical protein
MGEKFDCDRRKIDRFDFDPHQTLAAILTENGASGCDNVDVWIKSAHDDEPHYARADEEVLLDASFQTAFLGDKDYLLPHMPPPPGGRGARAIRSRSDYNKEAESNSRKGLGAQRAVAKIVAEEISNRLKLKEEKELFWQKVKHEWEDILKCDEKEKEDIFTR